MVYRPGMSLLSAGPGLSCSLLVRGRGGDASFRGGGAYDAPSTRGIFTKLHWTIAKARGNLRPLLICGIELEAWERKPATPPLRISSTIPEPPDSWQEYCYPTQLERAGQSCPGCYVLDIPPPEEGTAPRLCVCPGSPTKSTRKSSLPLNGCAIADQALLGGIR